MSAAVSDWLRWALLAVGAIYLISESTIFSAARLVIGRLVPRRMRWTVVFLYCPPCLGFWIGLALGALHLWPSNTSWWSIFESGVATMALGAIWKSHYSNIDRIYQVERSLYDEDFRNALAQEAAETSDDDGA